MSDTSHKPNFDNSSTENIYNECAANYRYYLDWRFKILTRHAISLGGVLLLAKYIIENESIPKQWVAAPSLVFSILSIIFLLMDLRHKALSQAAAKIAGKIENSWVPNSTENNKSGFFDYQVTAHKETPLTHSLMLMVIYAGSAVIGLCGVALALIIKA